MRGNEKLRPRNEVMPPTVACVITDPPSPHILLDRGSSDKRNSKAANELCRPCIQRDVCAATPRLIAAFLGAPSTIIGGKAVEVSNGIITSVQQQLPEPVFHFTPGDVPKKDSEGTGYVRCMYRGGEQPELSEKNRSILEIIKNQFPEDDLFSEDVTRVCTTTAAFLATEKSVPLSQILSTAQTIIADAHTLHERGIHGDTVEMAMRHSAIFYLKEPTVVKRKKSQQGKEQRRNEERDTPLSNIVLPEKTKIRKESEHSGGDDRTVALIEEEIISRLRNSRVTLTDAQERKVFEHMHTKEHTLSDLFTDEVFANDIQEKDRLKWLRIFRYSRDFGDLLVATNYGFLVNTANKFASQLLAKDIPFTNLLDEGKKGIRVAMDKYDPDHISEKGHARFLTYADSWIGLAIQEEIAAQNGIKRTLYRHLNNAIYIKYAFLEAIGRTPTLEELREQLVFNSDLGLTARDHVISFFETHYDKYYEYNLSLDRPLIRAPDSEKNLYDKIPAPINEEDAEGEILHESLNQLTPQQKTVITMMFGLNESERKASIKEIAQKLEIPSQDVKRLLNESLELFKKDPELEPLRKERTNKPEVIIETEEMEPIPSSETTIYTTPLPKRAGNVEHTDLPPTINRNLLTPRQTQIYDLYMQGKTTREIANELGLAVRGVLSHRLNIRIAASLPKVSEKQKYTSDQKDQQVAELRGQYMKHHEIAERLHMSVGTVDKSIRRLYASGALVYPAERDRMEREKEPSQNVALVAQWLETHQKRNLFVKHFND